MQHLIDLKLPLYDGGDMVLCRDVGHGAKMALIADTCEANYLDYVNTLRDACFTLTARNEIAGNRFTALQRDNIAVTLYYTAYARCVRVIVEPKANRYQEEPAGEPICQPCLTMIGRKFSESATYLGADATMGLTCFIFRLSDGAFLVYDGGVEIDAFADAIMDTLLKQAPDPEHIVIAGWFLSHTHGDHVGGIRRFCKKYPGKVILRQVLHNIPCDEDINHSLEKGVTAEYANSTLALVREAYPEAKLTKLHTGDCFFLHDAYIETLFTQEDFYTPARVHQGCRYWNDTSLVVRITLGGQTIIMLADTHIIANSILSAMYGRYLKSDFCQVAHHGGDGGTIEVYENIDPIFAFFTTSDPLLKIYLTHPHNAHLAYHLHLRGYANAEQRITVFPLPYTPPEGDYPIFVTSV